jgi:serine protease Do
MGPGVDPQQESEYFPTFVATVPRGKRFGLPVGIPAALFRDSMQAPPPVPDPGRREKSWIGITLQSVSRDLAEHWNMPVESGVAVTSVIEGSPGAEAGLRVGDVVISFDGRPVKAEKESDLDAFIRNVQKTGVGKPVELEVFRGGRVRKMELSLGRAPIPMRTAPSYTSRDFGMKVRDLTFDFLQRTNLPRDLRGVMVEELEQGGWARVGGLREGDVIRAVQRWEIGSVEEIRRALDRIREEKIREVVFFLQRGADTVFVSVRTDY